MAEIEWRDIASAPKDEDVMIVVCDAVGEAAVVRWTPYGGYWSLVVAGSHAEDGEFYAPTHWFPLPALPAPPETRG